MLPTTRATGQVDSLWQVAAATLECQEILQRIGKGVLPLVLVLVKPGHVIPQQVVLLPGSTSAIKVSQELLQILQATPQLPRLQ